MRPFFPTIAVFVLFLVFPSTGFSLDDSHRRMGRPGDCSALEALPLSVGQRRAVRDIEAQHTGRLLELRREIMLRHIELRFLIKDPSAEESQIRAKAGDIEALQHRFRQKMIDYQLAIRTVLTPAQLARWCTMVNVGRPSQGWGPHP